MKDILMHGPRRLPLDGMNMLVALRTGMRLTVIRDPISQRAMVWQMPGA
jgi:hypothetical protein